MSKKHDDSKERRAIDEKRDSAVYMELDGLPEGDKITEMVVVDDQLHLVTRFAIVRASLADDIDPERTNDTLPNTQQRVLSLGADAPIVGRTLLTAKGLFKPAYLSDKIDCEKGLSIAFAAMCAFAVMDEMASSLVALEAKAVENFDGKRRPDRSIALPVIGDVPARVDAYFQQTKKVFQATIDMITMAYGPFEGGWKSGMLPKISGIHGASDVFTKFVEEVVPILASLVNARNCIEHPKRGHRVLIKDFSVSPNGTLEWPSLEVVHPDTPHTEIRASSFMTQMNGLLLDIFESAMAYVCGKNIADRQGLPIAIIGLSEDERRSPHVRLGYAARLGDRWIPSL